MSPPGGSGGSSDGLIVRGRPPFAMTPTSLLRNPLISSHAVRLWSVLASYTYGDQATDRPSRARLAADIGWRSTRSVDSYLAELQNAGYLTVQARWRPDGGKARNLYILDGNRWNARTRPPPIHPARWTGPPRRLNRHLRRLMPTVSLTTAPRRVIPRTETIRILHLPPKCRQREMGDHRARHLSGNRMSPAQAARSRRMN